MIYYLNLDAINALITDIFSSRDKMYAFAFIIFILIFCQNVGNTIGRRLYNRMKVRLMRKDVG